MVLLLPEITNCISHFWMGEGSLEAKTGSRGGGTADGGESVVNGFGNWVGGGCKEIVDDSIVSRFTRRAGRQQHVGGGDSGRVRCRMAAPVGHARGLGVIGSVAGGSSGRKENNTRRRRKMKLGPLD